MGLGLFCHPYPCIVDRNFNMDPYKTHAGIEKFSLYLMCDSNLVQSFSQTYFFLPIHFLSLDFLGELNFIYSFI